jgi:DNA mismatch repair protein MutS2
MTIEKSRRQSEQERLQAESLRLGIEGLKKELEEQKHKLSSQKEKLLREAREEARKILLDARKDAEDILEELKQAAKLQDEKERRRAAEELKAKLRSNIGKIEESLAESFFQRRSNIEPPENLKPGDSVLILDLNRKGTVITPPDRDGEALVQAGIMKINVHVSNLKLVDEQSLEIRRTGSAAIGMSKAMSISPRIDIRGMNVDEAVTALGKFLDDAAIAGLSEVTIVHGKGTGALRNGVHLYLKTHHHVKSYRLGKYGEGESGVTIATLK